MSRPPKWTDFEIASLIESVNAGRSNAEIAVMLGRPYLGVETKRGEIVKQGLLKKHSMGGRYARGALPPCRGNGQEPPGLQAITMVASDWTDLAGGVRMRTYTAAQGEQA